MSSASYSASIQPDIRLRAIVLGSGALLGITGVLITCQLPVTAPWRWLAVLLWLGFGLAECLRTLVSYRERHRYILYAGGAMDIIMRDGTRATGSLAAGSLVLPTIAWLCVRASSGRCCGELVRGNAHSNEDWRRLQVICRHPTAC
ncbi:MAG TPA: hypothetical protein PKK10_02170 [Woeseiaceae bacterium]|nr:hypothetical protein [Woeseiaceae bacterium]